MKKLLLTSIWIFMSLKFINAQDTKVILNKIWESPTNLYTCESILFDESNNLIYVSCINGNPTEKDGNGFISVLSEYGDVMHYHWIDGLNAPKGMGLNNGDLYVTDIDRVIKINIATAKIDATYLVEGAKFLNDITIDQNSNVYISDMATGIIHRIHNNVVGPWLSNPPFNGPNGLNMEDGELLIGTRKGIMSVRLEDQRIWQVIEHLGSIDGLEPDGKGNYIISDWAGKVQRISPNHDPVLIMDTSVDGINAADFHFIPSKNLLIVPTFSSNRVDAYTLVIMD